MASNLLAAVGNTPLIELDVFAEIPGDVRLFAKLEGCNPGGSIKDRPVARMLSRAHDEGCFEAGRGLLDSSSGNAGIAYAMFGAALGIDVTLVVPENTSRKRLEWISAHGAELILTDAAAGYDLSIRTAERLAVEHPERYWYANQLANENNWRAHYETTGDEILAQVMMRSQSIPAAFVSGVGTGGTITGVGRRLREGNPDLHIAAAIPDPLAGIEGLKAFQEPGEIVPEILDESIIDEHIPVTKDQAIDACHRLSQAGLLVGPSSGAHVHAALQVAALGAHPVVVTILCDTGERYGSDLWSRAAIGSTLEQQGLG